MAFFSCESCGFEKEVSDQYVGRHVNCPNCKHSSEVKNAQDVGERESLPSFIENSAESSSEINSENSKGFFDYIEECLLKMIFGSLKCIFVIFPLKLLSLFKSSFPYVIRTFKILFLFAVWLAILCWPYYLYNYEPFFYKNKEWFQFAMIGWFLLVLAGSFWGLSKITLPKVKEYFAKRKKRNDDSLDH